MLILGNLLHACTGNLHFCVYGAFGAALLYRSIVSSIAHKHDVAREDAVIGILHIVLAML